MTETYSVNDHFVNKDPSVRALYDELVSILQTFGPVAEYPKNTSIHLNRKSALAGVETRKDGLLLNTKSDHQIQGPRIEKAEQVSAKDFITKCEFLHQRTWMRNLKPGSGKHIFFRSGLVS